MAEGEIAALGLASPALAVRAHERTSQALRSWSARWGIEASCAVEPWLQGSATSEAPASERLREQSAHRAARLLWPSMTLDHALLKALYGADVDGTAPHSLAQRSVQHVATDLRKTLAEAWHVGEWQLDAEGSAAPAAYSVWDAALDIQIDVGGALISAQVPGLRFRAAQAPAPLRPSTGAAALTPFHGLTTSMTAVVGQAEVCLADIASLQCGDVLLLDTSIQEPVRLVIDGGTVALYAGLGQQNGRRALQLLSSPKS